MCRPSRIQGLLIDRQKCVVPDRCIQFQTERWECRSRLHSFAVYRILIECMKNRHTIHTPGTVSEADQM